MKLPVALIVLCISHVVLVDAHLSGILSPIKSLLGWKAAENQTKTDRVGNENSDPAHKPEKIDSPTKPDDRSPEGVILEDDHGQVAFVEDFNTTAPSESPVDSSNAGAADTMLSPSSSATSSSGVLNSVQPTTTPTTSVSSVPTTDGVDLQMVDLKIPGGESPDSEVLPDAGSFKPKEESKSSIAEPTKEDSESAGKDLAAAISSAVVPPSTSATKVEDADEAKSPESSAARQITKEGAGGTDRFVQPVNSPTRSHVVLDVDDLFQSED